MLRSVIAIALLLRLALPSPGEDWKIFLGPSGNGKSSETGILTDWSDGKLKLRWAMDVDTSYGIGAIASQRYYQFDRVDDVQRLICADAQSGKKIWSADQTVSYQDQYGYNNGPRSSPVIVDDRVFTYGVDGRLSCYDCKDGKILWSHALNKKYGVIQNFFGVASCPVPYRDLIIVMVGGSPKADSELPPGRLDRVSGNATGIVAFRQSDGSEVYHCSNELASYSTPTIATIQGQPIGLALMRGGLLAFDPASGKRLWDFPWRAPRLESVNAAVPIVHGDEVFISECYDIGSVLLKVSASGNKVLWQDPPVTRQQAFRAHWATPILHNGALFGCSGRNRPDSDLRCIGWDDAKVKWTHPCRTRSSLLYVDGHFVVLYEDGLMELIKASSDSYQLTTSIDLSRALAGYEAPFLMSPCWAAPILSDGLMYVRGANRVACFELIPPK